MFISQGAAGTIAISGEIETVQKGANTIEALPKVTVNNTATLMFGANDERCRMFIRADPANTEAIYIGDVGITNPGTTEEGWPLFPGEGIEIIGNAATYAISENGGQSAYRMDTRES